MVIYAKQHNKQRICKKRINESPHSQKRETRVGEYGKYSSICPNYRENMGNIVVFAQTIGRIWEI